MKKLWTLAVITAIVAGLYFSIWYLGKFVNYKFSYENMVKDTCREMIKEEIIQWHRSNP
jgi:hypothetical protein